MAKGLFLCQNNAMSYEYYNPNPNGSRGGDCVVRAISFLTGQAWERTYVDLCIQGFILCDMPSINSVWGAYLKSKGFKPYVIPDNCPDCYTVKKFVSDHPWGEYMLATGSHVVAVKDGNYYDSWDSGDEIPVYYWMKGATNGV